MDDYLPPLSPTTNRQARSAKKTLLLWAVLIVLVIAVYQLFLPAPGVAEPPVEDSGWSFGWGALPLPAVLLFLWWQLRRSAQFNRGVEPGMIALADGELARA